MSQEDIGDIVNNLGWKMERDPGPSIPAALSALEGREGK